MYFQYIFHFQTFLCRSLSQLVERKWGSLPSKDHTEAHTHSHSWPRDNLKSRIKLWSFLFRTNTPGSWVPKENPHMQKEIRSTPHSFKLGLASSPRDERANHYTTLQNTYHGYTLNQRLGNLFVCYERLDWQYYKSNLSYCYYWSTCLLLFLQCHIWKRENSASFLKKKKKKGSCLGSLKCDWVCGEDKIVTSSKKKNLKKRISALRNQTAELVPSCVTLMQPGLLLFEPNGANVCSLWSLWMLTSWLCCSENET